jgi:hypothetical protein
MTQEQDHLAELIEQAQTEPDVEYDQPPGVYVQMATDEYEAAGYTRDQVPERAIAMRAHEIRRAEEAEEPTSR